MQTYVSHAVIALTLLAGTGTAGAQTWTYEPNGTAVGRPLQLTPAQRTTIYRTIVPQTRGRKPIIREQIVIEPVAPAPVARERVVAPVDNYAYDRRYDDRYRYDNAYAYAPPAARRVVTVPDTSDDYAYAIGTRVPAAVTVAPLPRRVVSEVPMLRSYRYVVVDSRVMLVDPVTNMIVAELAGY